MMSSSPVRFAVRVRAPGCRQGVCTPGSRPLLRFLFVIAILASGSALTEEHLLAQDRPALDQIRVVQISAGKPDEKGGADQTWAQAASGVLTLAGFDVTRTAEEPADATLEISPGQASISLSPAPNWAPIGSTHHMGVKTQGSLSLRGKHSVLYSGVFEGVSSCFLNPVNKKAIEDCLDGAMRPAHVSSKVKAMVVELWPDRGAVLAALQPANEEERSQGLRSLKEMIGGNRGAWIAPALVSSLRHPAAAVRENALKTLVELKDPRTPALLLAALESKDSILQGGAARALGRMGEPRAKQPLMLLLDKGAPDAQEGAAEALGQMGAREAVEHLMAGLASPSAGVQIASVRALGKLKDPRAVPLLTSALQGGSPAMRQASAMALGEMGDPAAVDPLIAALSDSASAMRLAAATALGDIGDKKAIPPLLDHLRADSPDVRVAVAAGLGKFHDASLAGPLIPLLKEKDPAIRKASSEALAQLSGQNFGEDRKSWEQWWKQHKKTLVQK